MLVNNIKIMKKKRLSKPILIVLLILVGIYAYDLFDKKIYVQQFGTVDNGMAYLLEDKDTEDSAIKFLEGLKFKKIEDIDSRNIPKDYKYVIHIDRKYKPYSLLSVEVRQDDSGMYLIDGWSQDRYVKLDTTQTTFVEELIHSTIIEE